MASMGQYAALLQIGIRADTHMASQNLTRLQSTLSRTGTSARTATTHTDRFQRSSSRLGSTLGTVGKAAIGAAAAYIGISQAKQAIEVTTELAKSTKLLQNNLKLSAENASSFAAVAKTRGVDTRGLAMATKTLATQADQAAKGASSSVEAFNALGISQKELKGLHGEKLLLAIAQGAKEAGKTIGTTAALGKLLGRSFAPLGALFRDGAKGMKEQQQTAKDLGASFSDLGAKNANDLIQKMRESKLAIMGLQIQFTQLLQPVLMKAMGWFTDLAKNIHREGFVKAMGDAITQMANKAGELAPKVAGAFFQGFANAGIWGKLAIGAFLLSKMGGLGAFSALGGAGAAAFWAAFIAAPVVIAGVGINEALKHQNDDIVSGQTGQAIAFKEAVDKMIASGKHLTAAQAHEISKRSIQLANENQVDSKWAGETVKHMRNVEAGSHGVTKAVSWMAGQGIKNMGGLGKSFQFEVDKMMTAIVLGKDPIDQLGASFKTLENRISNAMSQGKISVEKGTRLINEMIAQERALLGLPPIAGGAFTLPSKQHGKSPKPHGPGGQEGIHRQRGGFLPGPSLGDRIPLLAEGGEFMVNAKATKRFLPLLERINQAVPRFAKGGQLAGLRFTGSGPGNLDDLAAGALNMEADWARSYINKLKARAPGSLGGGSAAWKAVDALANSFGDTTHLGMYDRLGEQGSWHGVAGPGGRSRATDYSGGNMLGFARKMAKRYGSHLLELIHTPLGYSIKDGHRTGLIDAANHYNHVHVAMQRGGQIFGGGSLNKNQLTTLAAYVGMPNPALMAAIAMAESSGIPTRRGAAGEYGLWQILPSTADAFGIPKGNLLDPIKNARGAAKILKGQGLGAWTTYSSGAYKKFLGGKVKPGLLARLQGVTGGVAPGTTGKTTAKKKGKDAGQEALSVPQDIQDIIQAYYDNLQVAVDVENERRSSLNDLYSQANLSALQGYQVAASQNPLVGLGAPNAPSLYGMWGMLADAAQAPDLSNLSSLADINTAAVNAFLVSRGQAPTGIYGSPGRGATPRRRHTAPAIHNHFYVDGKEIQGITQVAMRKASRRGRRRLPSAGA